MIITINLFPTCSHRQTQLSIYFKDTSVKVLRRVETYTFTEFLAICGGLLGLFLGISLLSVVEIIYFATLRLFWIIYRPRTQKIEITPEIPLPEHSENQMVCSKLFFSIINIFVFHKPKASS